MPLLWILPQNDAHIIFFYRNALLMCTFLIFYISTRYLVPIYCSDEFELEFPELSWAKLKGFRAELSQTEAFQFSSWNRAENIIYCNDESKKRESNFRLVLGHFSISSWEEKATSRVELSWKSLSLSYGSSQLGSNSSLLSRYLSKKWFLLKPIHF